MKVLEIAQGRYGRLDGMPRDTALRTFVENDEAFITAHPAAAKYHRPCWREIDVSDTASAPWGFEWYQYVEDKLTFHSAQYDSSG